MAAPGRRELVIRLIVLYKFVKAAVEIATAVGLVALAASGELAALRGLAIDLKENLVSRWSLLLGRVLEALVSQRGLHLLEVGLALDGVLSGIEGFALWRGYRWGPWLVIAATSIPLPLEIEEILRTHRPSRVALVLVNLAVVVYLVRRIRRGDRR